MTEVLNGPVFPGDTVTYSARKFWDMYTRIALVVRVDSRGLLVRVVKSSDGRAPKRLVRLTELQRVVRISGLGLEVSR